MEISPNTKSTPEHIQKSYRQLVINKPDLILTKEDVLKIKQAYSNVDEIDSASKFESSLNSELIDSVVKIINICLAYDIDTVFFLDKSARPDGSFFTSAWQKINKVTMIGKLPNIRYINIGTSSDNWMDEKVQMAIASKYRDIVEAKKVLIVDDHKDSGTTLVRAQQLFEKCFSDQTELHYKYSHDDQPQWNYATEKHLNGVYEPKHKTQKNLFGYNVKKLKFGNHKQKLQEFKSFREKLHSLADIIAENLTLENTTQPPPLETPSLVISRLISRKIFVGKQRDHDVLTALANP